MSLHILITNIEMRKRSGTTLYVRDLALELRSLGHFPVIYTLKKGSVSNELEEAAIPVTTNLRQIDFKPAIIHGHHLLTTISAAQYFPNVPAIFICHDHTAWTDKAPLHPHIRRYFGVSRVCVERLIKDGVSQDNVKLLPNFVDTRRFLPRSLLPKRPRRALVFSNYANAQTHLPAVTEACRRAGLELDVLGAGVGKPVSRPEDILGNYDIVFAKAKAALEAMAVGTAVILCDFSGVGPMVTSAEFDELRPLNFGFQALYSPLQPDLILHQIARYDPQDAARVHTLLRARANLEQAGLGLVDIYREVIEEQKTASPLLCEKRIEINQFWLRLSIWLYKLWALFATWVGGRRLSRLTSKYVIFSIINNIAKLLNKIRI
ncbi:MAG: glycosyltransferase [Deltaproteobacteria bacterium]|nr:glycosyltransferase [Deltaproteobacteria bacterium]